jgi:hypothetical protein
MIGIEVEIIEYTDESQPGWVKCKLTDAFKKDWYIIEKVPIVSSEYLTAQSIYPKIGFIAVKVIETSVNEKGTGLAIIDTSIPWGINDENGETRFTVLRSQLINSAQ